MRLADAVSRSKAEDLLLKVFQCAEGLNPFKDSLPYWMTLNRTMLRFHPKVREFWEIEKQVTLEAIDVSKIEALTIPAQQRDAIMRLTREQAIKGLIRYRNIDGRERVIKSVIDNGILSIPSE